MDSTGNLARANGAASARALSLPDEPLRLGDYLCNAEALLRAARDGSPSRAVAGAGAASGASPGDGGRQPLRGRVERDALTGEIVRRRP